MEKAIGSIPKESDMGSYCSGLKLLNKGYTNLYLNMGKMEITCLVVCPHWTPKLLS